MDFVEYVLAHCEQIQPDIKGIFFAVESVENSEVDQALSERLARKQNLNPPADEELMGRLKRLAQLAFAGFRGLKTTKYGNQRANTSRALLLDKGNGLKPFPYRQPALRAPLDVSNEPSLWLMLYPMPAVSYYRDNAAYGIVSDPLIFSEEDIHGVLSFLYEHLFPSLYDIDYIFGTATRTSIPGYRSYVRNIYDELVYAVNGGVVSARQGALFTREMIDLLLRRNSLIEH